MTNAKAKAEQALELERRMAHRLYGHVTPTELHQFVGMFFVAIEELDKMRTEKEG